MGVKKNSVSRDPSICKAHPCSLESPGDGGAQSGRGLWRPVLHLTHDWGLSWALVVSGGSSSQSGSIIG